MKRKTNPYKGGEMKKIGILVLMVLSIVWVWGADYGSMYITAGEASKSTSTAFSLITGYTSMATSGCTYTTDGITTGATVGEKRYLIRYSLSFYGDAALWSFGVKIGDGTTRGIIERRISEGGTDVGNAAGSFIATIPQNTEIVLQIKVDSETANYTPVHSQLVVVELSEAGTPKYGEMQIVNNGSQQTLDNSGDSDYNPLFTTVEHFGNTHSNLSGWVFASNALTASSGSAGTYLAILSTSFNSTLSTSFEFGVSLNGYDPYGESSDTQIVLKRTVGDTDIGNGGACGIISISDDDVVSIQAKAAGTGAQTITTQYASLTLLKIADNTLPPYAGMRVNNNVTKIDLPHSIWVKEVDFVSDILHPTYWDFSDTEVQLTPKNSSAGDYLVNYYLSISVPLGSDTKYTFNTLCAIFNNGSQLSDLTTERTLERKKNDANNQPDVAAIAGTAIITIEQPDDALYLQLQNIDQDNTMNPIIRYANVNLFRISTKGDGALPVTLSNFSAAYIGSVPIIAWTTQSESGNAGWNVYRGDSPEALQNGDAFLVNGSLIDGAGTTSEPTNYTFTDEYVYSTNTSYYYWLESVSISGVTENHGPVQLYIPNNNPGSPAVPTAFGLYQNYPNPFNPTTAISFSVPSTTRATLTIYNQTGAKVTTLFQDIVPAKEVQTLTWDGTDSFGKEVASGIYLYKLQTEKDTFTRRMMLIK